MDFFVDVLALYVERTDFFIRLLLEHLYLTAVAVLIISFLGIGIGLLMTRDERMASVIMALTNFIYTVPSIALFGFLVALTGIGEKSAIIALTLYGLLPIVRNTYTGIVEVEEEIIEAARGMGSTPRQLLWRIQFPLALPVIMTGYRTMVIMTIALAGIAYFIGAGGLGVAIYRGITTNYPALTVAGSLLVALLAIAIDLILGRVESRIRHRVLGES